MRRHYNAPIAMSCIALIAVLSGSGAVSSLAFNAAQAEAQPPNPDAITLSPGPIIGPKNCAEIQQSGFRIGLDSWFVDMSVAVPPLEEPLSYNLQYRITQGSQPTSDWTSDAGPGSQAMGTISPNPQSQTVSIRTPLWGGALYEFRLGVGGGPPPVFTRSVSVQSPQITCTSVLPPGPDSPTAVSPPAKRTLDQNEAIAAIRNGWTQVLVRRLKRVRISCVAVTEAQQACTVSGLDRKKRVKRAFVVRRISGGRVSVKVDR